MLLLQLPPQSLRSGWEGPMSSHSVAAIQGRKISHDPDNKGFSTDRGKPNLRALPAPTVDMQQQIRLLCSLASWSPCYTLALPLNYGQLLPYTLSMWMHSEWPLPASSLFFYGNFCYQSCSAIVRKKRVYQG